MIYICDKCYLYFVFPSFRRPFLWGPAAANHHQTAKSLGPSLWQQPSVGEVLEQVDASKMYQSAVAFPQSRLLQVCVVLMDWLIFSTRCRPFSEQSLRNVLVPRLLFFGLHLVIFCMREVRLELLEIKMHLLFCFVFFMLASSPEWAFSSDTPRCLRSLLPAAVI